MFLHIPNFVALNNTNGYFCLYDYIHAFMLISLAKPSRFLFGVNFFRTKILKRNWTHISYPTEVSTHLPVFEVSKK